MTYSLSLCRWSRRVWIFISTVSFVFVGAGRRGDEAPNVRLVLCGQRHPQRHDVALVASHRQLAPIALDERTRSQFKVQHPRFTTRHAPA